MDKLVERETATRNPLVAAPALAVQFFLIPLAVVGVTVLVYVGLPVAARRRPDAGQDYLTEDSHRRLAPPVARRVRVVAADGRPEGAGRSGRSAPALVKAFDEAKDDDPRVRRYLALAIGRLEPPLPPEAVAVLLKSLDDPGSRGPRRLVAHQRLDRAR